jgi:hypothetical protein
MNDGEQTPSGSDFWVRRMADASAKNLRVGIANVAQKTIIWFDPIASNKTFKEWFEGFEPVGTQQKFEAIRYVISQ